MKTTKLILLCFILTSLNADTVLNDTQKYILEKKLEKSIEESHYKKDSWINPLYIEASKSKSKLAITDTSIKSDKISINIDQEIYKNGAILDTISKGKNLEKLSHLSYQQQRQFILFLIYNSVINLKKIDIEIQKLTFLIENKNIEIDTKQSLYENGIVDISELDQGVIALSNLKNSVQNLNIEKATLVKELKRYSFKKYHQIDLNTLNKISHNTYINNNINIYAQELLIKDTKYDKEITKASYLPKLSLYGSYGYDDTQYQKDDDFYAYGLKVTMPLDYNYNKSIKSSKLQHKIANLELNDIKEDEENFYKLKKEQLKYIEKKINNTQEIISRYKNIYETVNNLYQNSLKTKEDVTTIKNSINVVELDIKNLQLDKKLIFNHLFKNLDLRR